jgi:hypothetical protein
MLIKRATLKQQALALAARRFAGTPFEDKYTRVSTDLYDAAEAHLREWLTARINNMPTIGKTIH